MEISTYEVRSSDYREQHFSGTVAIGAAGAVGALTPVALSGITGVTKVGGKVGRYKLQLYRPFKRVKLTVAGVIGSADTAAANTTGESGTPMFRVEQVSVDGSILLQLRRQSDNADAEATSGTVVTYHIIATDA